MASYIPANEIPVLKPVTTTVRVFRPLAYTEGEYEAFCDLKAKYGDRLADADVIAGFGKLPAEQMQRRWDMDFTCPECGDLLDLSELNDRRDGYTDDDSPCDSCRHPDPRRSLDATEPRDE